MEIIKGKITWIDIYKPTDSDIRFLKNNYQIHPLILEELLGPSARSKVEVFSDYLFLVYFFPSYNESEKISYQGEVDFIIAKNFVVTAHYENFVPIKEFKNKLENENYKKQALETTYNFTYNLLETFISYLEREQHHISDKVEYISYNIFKGKEEELLREISFIKRDMASYALIIHLQETVLKSLAANAPTFWKNPNVKILFDDLAGDQLRVLNQINNIREIINGLENTNNQLLSVKTTKIISIFTILAFLTFPFTLFISILGLKAQGTPFVNMANGFWIISGLVIFCMLALLLYFKNKNWL